MFLTSIKTFFEREKITHPPRDDLYISIGERYYNRVGEIIKIRGQIPSFCKDYRDGYRYVDQYGARYTESGGFYSSGVPSIFDIDRHITSN